MNEFAIGRRRGNPWTVLIIVSLAFFMSLLDLNIVNIAIPNMISGLHASLDEILWVINGYALALPVLLITTGRLGDLHGTRNIFIIGVTLFTAASVACGLAANPGELIGFRVVQGVGAATMMPQTLVMITETWPQERRGVAMGVWSAIAGLAAVVGPTLGGLIVTAFDWRWIFFLNLPVGLTAALGAWFFCPNVRPGHKRLDIWGTILVSLALLGICYGVIEGQKYNWGTITSFISIPLIIAVGVVLFAAFLVVQAARQKRDPLLPFGLFRDRNFTVVNWVSVAVTVSMLGFVLLMTLYLQDVLGMSPLRAGLTLAASSLTAFFVAPPAGLLTDRVGGKYILLTGLVLFGAGLAWLIAIAQPGSRWYALLPALIVTGAGMGCIFPPLVTVAMQNVPSSQAGAASGVLNSTRQLGDVLGITMVGALLQTQLATSLAHQAIQSSAGLPGAVRRQFVEYFRTSATGSAQVGGTAHMKLPPGIPASLAGEITRLVHEAFGQGFVTAMRTTVLLPIAVLGVAAVSCLALRGRGKTAPEPVPATEHGSAAQVSP